MFKNIKEIINNEELSNKNKINKLKYFRNYPPLQLKENLNKYYENINSLIFELKDTIYEKKFKSNNNSLSNLKLNSNTLSNFKLKIILKEEKNKYNVNNNIITYKFTLKLFNKNKFIGHLILRYNNNYCIFIEHLVIIQQYQNKNLATYLINFVKNNFSYELIELNCKPKLVPFYKKLGFNDEMGNGVYTKMFIGYHPTKSKKKVNINEIIRFLANKINIIVGLV